MDRLMNTGHPITPDFFRLLATLLLALLFTGVPQATPAAEQALKQTGQEEQAETTLSELITSSTQLSKDLIDLHSRLGDIVAPKEGLNELPAIEQTLASLNWEAMMQQADSNLNYKRLSDTILLLNQQQDTLNAIAEPLNEAITLLSEQEKRWSRQQQILAEQMKSLTGQSDFSLIQENFAALEKSIDSAVATLRERKRQSLETLQKVSSLQVTLYNLKVSTDDLLEDLSRQALEQTSPSIFSHKFYSQLTPDLLHSTWQNIEDGYNKAFRLIRNNSRFFALVIILPVLLTVFLRFNRKTLSRHRGWSMLTESPGAFSVFTCLIFIIPWLESTSAHLLPPVSIVFIFSVMLLAGELEKKEIWVARFIYFLSIFLILNIVVEFINLPMPLKRLFHLLGSWVWLTYFIWRIIALHRRRKGKKSLKWGLYLTSLTLSVAIFSGLFGYDELALYLFKGVFLTIFIFISSIILFDTVRILLELLLGILPVIRHHAGVIVKALQPLIFALCALFFFCLTAVIWHIFPTTQDTLTALAAFGVPLGNYTLTMNTVFMVVVILYGAILSSRAIQAILLGDLMPRYGVDTGVQLSIAKLIHYTILLIGFFILLQALGVSLTKLTILGGALGVGIGFGLQTIVNNFASGLILLFERPIKIGDTIQLGTNFGNVKKLGLRSTIIQTFDNAEIVVPNSELIAAQVTNWTLAERRIRLKIPVGVAYGSDIEKVLEILLTIGREHPMTLTTPAPRALFLSFGASSLDFELRVWIPDFSDRRLILSEINQEINSEFNDAGIEIPFPQTDLHLRTVDEQAQAALRPHESGEKN